MSKTARVQATMPTALEERLARRAAAEQDEEQKDVLAERQRLEEEEDELRKAERIDLLRVIREEPKAFPLEVAMWQILIEMYRPKDRMGRFIKVESQRETEQYLTTVGRVLMCGPTAMSGKTESGIPLDQLTATIKTPEQLIGKYVIIQRYTGNDLFFAPWPVKKLRYITATEILSVTDVPGMWVKQ